MQDPTIPNNQSQPPQIPVTGMPLANGVIPPVTQTGIQIPSSSPSDRISPSPIGTVPAQSQTDGGTSNALPSATTAALGSDQKKEPAVTVGKPEEKKETRKNGEAEVKKVDIEKVVSNWTGIPITKLTEDEGAKLLNLEKRIHQRLIDQEEAVTAVSEAVRRGRIGLASANRPIASFIFLGPSGTGKTELAKT